jgi:hypothetical protein
MELNEIRLFRLLKRPGLFIESRGLTDEEFK